MSNQRGFCSNCGAQVAAGASFCEACGKPVAQVAEPPTPPLQPAQITAPPPGATSAPMMWVIAGCAVVGVAIAILAALALSGYVLSQQGNVSQARGTMTRTVMPSVPLPIVTTPVPAVTTSIADVPLATPSLTQPAAQMPPMDKTPADSVVSGNILIEDGRGAMGGYEGDTIQASVTYTATSRVASVAEMRTVRGCWESTLQDAAWEPFVRQKTFPVRVILNWSGFSVSVQYRDAQGNLSPAYCADINVEGMPRPPTTAPAAAAPTTPTATPSLTQPAAQVSPSPAGAAYDLYVRRIDYQPTGANLVAGQPIRFNIMIATDIYPPAGPLFPTSRFRWRPGSTYNWTEAFCPADTHYAKCDSTFEFTYGQPGTYEFEVEADPRGEIAETNKANNRGSVTIQVRQAAATAPPTAVPSTPVGGPVPGAISVFFTIRDGSPTGWVYDKQGIKHTPGYNTISGISASPGDRIVLQTDTARFSLLFDCSTTPGTFNPCDFSADSSANLPREIRAVKNGMSAFLNISRADNWAGVRPGFAPQRYPADPVLRIVFSW